VSKMILADMKRAVGSLSMAMVDRDTAFIQAIVRTADEVTSHFDQLSAGLVADLENIILAHQIWGLPPSFIHVAGQGGLEKPFNRLLAWWADINAEHGLAKEFLKLLAQLADLPELVEDVDYSMPEVKAEQAIKGVSNGKMPDFMVRSDRAVLMIENKVGAPESGDQYGPYLKTLQIWADGRKCRAILSARDERKIPEDWDRMLTHQELAEKVFEQLWNLDGAPMWGRIAAKITSLSFCNVSADNASIKRVKELLELYASANKRLSVKNIMELETLRARIPLPAVLKGVPNAK